MLKTRVGFRRAEEDTEARKPNLRRNDFLYTQISQYKTHARETHEIVSRCCPQQAESPHFP